MKKLFFFTNIYKLFKPGMSGSVFSLPVATDKHALAIQ